MRKSLLIIAFASVLVTIIVNLSMVEQPIAWSENVGNSGLGITMTTDKAVYKEGDPVIITMMIFNRTKNKVTFQFRNGQRYDFIIRDARGSEIWRWSKGRMFTMALGQITLGPQKQEIVYTEIYKGKLDVGSYKITGLLADYQRAMSSSLVISVR